MPAVVGNLFGDFVYMSEPFPLTLAYIYMTARRSHICRGIGVDEEVQQPANMLVSVASCYGNVHETQTKD